MPLCSGCMAPLSYGALHNRVRLIYMGFNARYGSRVTMMRRDAMKVILQAYEPMPQPFARIDAEVAPMAPVVRKSRVRLLPVKAETRLFHAL